MINSIIKYSSNLKLSHNYLNPFLYKKNNQLQLGRWKLNDYIERKIDLANVDNCGDKLCSYPIDDKNIIYQQKSDSQFEIENIVNDYNRRWKQNITVEDFNKNFKK